MAKALALVESKENAVRAENVRLRKQLAAITQQLKDSEDQSVHREAYMNQEHAILKEELLHWRNVALRNE
jgi:hypothetical protein